MNNAHKVLEGLDPKTQDALIKTADAVINKDGKTPITSVGDLIQHGWKQTESMTTPQAQKNVEEIQGHIKTIDDARATKATVETIANAMGGADAVKQVDAAARDAIQAIKGGVPALKDVPADQVANLINMSDADWNKVKGLVNDFEKGIK